MDVLLETTLTMLNAMEYLPNFKKFGVDSSVLALLTDEDLKVIGIEDEELRSKFIKQCSHIPLLSETKFDLTIDEKYLMNTLHEIDQHLLLLNASLNYALKRKDIQLCDVKLSKASECLVTCTDSFHKEFLNFHHLFSPKKYKKKNRFKLALLSIVSAVATGFVVKRYLL